MKYRLIKYTQGIDVRYEIQEFFEFNWLGRWHHGYDGYWKRISTIFPSYEKEALAKFDLVDKQYLDSKCEIKEEILREI